MARLRNLGLTAALGLAGIIGCNGGNSTPEPMPPVVYTTTIRNVQASISPSKALYTSGDSVTLNATGEAVNSDGTLATIDSVKFYGFPNTITSIPNNGGASVNATAQFNVPVVDKDTPVTIKADYIYRGKENNGATKTLTQLILDTTIQPLPLPTTTLDATITLDPNKTSYQSGETVNVRVRATATNFNALPGTAAPSVQKFHVTSLPDLNNEYIPNPVAASIDQTFAVTVPPVSATKQMPITFAINYQGAENSGQMKTETRTGPTWTVNPVPELVATALKSGTFYAVTNTDSGKTVIGPTGTIAAMDGDKLRYFTCDANGNPAKFLLMVTLNGAENTSGQYGVPLIDNIQALLGWRSMTGANYLQEFGLGTKDLGFDQTYTVYYPQGTAEATTPLVATINARGPPQTNTVLANYTFTPQGPSVDAKPAGENIYQASTENAVILSKIDQLSEILSHGRASDNNYYTAADWKAFLLQLQDNVNNSSNREAVSYNASFRNNAVYINQTFGFVESSTLSRSDVYKAKKLLDGQ